MYLFQQYLADIATLAGASSIALASTQRDAIESARVKKPFLIMSDIKLSQGSGIDAINVIAADHGIIPVIYVTGYPEYCATLDARDTLLTKPVTAEVLLGTVRAVFERAAADAAPH